MVIGSGSGVGHAFIYSDGVVTTIGTQGGVGLAINDHGDVTGGYYFGGNCSRAFVYKDQQLHDLGTLPGGCASGGSAINDAGHVAGVSTGAEGKYRAVLFKDGTITELGTLPGDEYSSAHGINNLGVIVGSSALKPNSRRKGKRAFIFCDGTMTLLDDLLDPATGTGWRLHSASDINDAGQIVGWGLRDGTPRQFLLTPVAP